MSERELRERIQRLEHLIGLTHGPRGLVYTPGAMQINAQIHASQAVGCRVYRGTTQSIPSGLATAQSFDTAVHDTDAFWTLAAPTQLFVRHSGYYLAGGGFSMATGTAAVFRMSINVIKNDSLTLATQSISTGLNAAYYLNVATGVFWMDAGDYVEILAYQQSGGSLNTNQATVTNHTGSNGWLFRIA